MNPKIKFYVSKTSFWPQAAAVLLGLAAIFQFVGCWGRWNDRFFALTQMVLPVAAFLLYAMLLMLLGKSALWLTSLPFLAGIAFYAFQLWPEEALLIRMVGLAVCAVAAVLYLATVFTLIRTKWLLVVLFAVPFLYRAFYRDVLILQTNGDQVSFFDGMCEVSFLCVLLAMTFASIGMRKLVKEKKSKGKESTDTPSAAPAAAPAPIPTPAPVPPPAEAAPQEPGPAEEDREEAEIGIEY